jgi:hypothetical protein
LLKKKWPSTIKKKLRNLKMSWNSLKKIHKRKMNKFYNSFILINKVIWNIRIIILKEFKRKERMFSIKNMQIKIAGIAKKVNI